MTTAATAPLEWIDRTINGFSYHEAILGDFADDDGVRFTLTYQPTCHRRGPWKLLIEVEDREHRWGCFDDQDQPVRYYHSEANARSESEAIAAVLVSEVK